MGASASTTSTSYPGLLAWLASHDVEYEVHEHRQAFTARGVANAEGVDPHTFAKVVGARTADGRDVLLVVETTDHVDLRKAAHALGADEVHLLSEAAMTDLAPDCEAGALPAVGPLFGLPMLADRGLHDQEAISFNAGSHRASVRVDRAGWERACGVTYADIAESQAGQPVWSES
jgi:Ala-tRNA(Pro) deacylase